LTPRIVIAVCAVVGCAIALAEYPNFSGYCRSQQRYLSDAELIASAIKNNLARHSPEANSSRQKSYASIDEFYQQNPNCCVLHRWDSGPFGNSVLLRFFGFYEALVDIFYRINDSAAVDNFYGSMSIVDSCGRVMEVRGSPYPEEMAKVFARAKPLTPPLP
jgi:hypothetical protein